MHTEHSQEPGNVSTAHDPWWRSAVIYQVYIRSFADGDGDGTGDIAGLRSRLQYLAYLGADAIWINPWYPSPLADGGYDVSNFRDIHPTYGTLDEARKLITEAHELGLRVILDIVPNHTSDQHAWFQKALAAAPGSRNETGSSSVTGEGRTAASPPTTGTRPSAAPPGPARRTDSGTSTSSPPNNPTSTGTTPRSEPSSSPSCASGSTWAWTASASTSPTAWSRTRPSRTSA